jgi:carbon storage regulator
MVGGQLYYAYIQHIHNTEVKMLVLSRRESERIKLGNSITLTVIRVSGDRVRLGIEAPADIVVLREELQTQPQGGAIRMPRTA